MTLKKIMIVLILPGCASIIRDKHRWTIIKGNPGSQLYMFIHQDIAMDREVGELGM